MQRHVNLNAPMNECIIMWWSKIIDQHAYANGFHQYADYLQIRDMKISCMSNSIERNTVTNLNGHRTRSEGCNIPLAPSEKKRHTVSWHRVSWGLAAAGVQEHPCLLQSATDRLKFTSQMTIMISNVAKNISHAKSFQNTRCTTVHYSMGQINALLCSSGNAKWIS